MALSTRAGDAPPPGPHFTKITKQLVGPDQDIVLIKLEAFVFPDRVYDIEYNQFLDEGEIWWFYYDTVVNFNSIRLVYDFFPSPTFLFDAPVSFRLVDRGPR
jgi:hypothetical protein